MFLSRNLLFKDHFRSISKKKLPYKNFLCKMHSHPSPLDSQDDSEEVKIPLPWGHVSAKWWGSKDVRPILCIHGWQDNAGTFDRLIPLLPNHLSYLAIDIPGHGFSTWYPHGMIYQAMDYINVINIIRKEYGWDKVSLLTHSLGSILGFNYCGIFPDLVDMMVGIEFLSSHIPKIEQHPLELANTYDNFLVADERNRNKSEPPSYTFEEAIKRFNEGTKNSVTVENCHYILRRNLRKSEKYPDKYYFARDNRLKYTVFTRIPQAVNIEFAKRMQMPYLFIKASKAPWFGKKEHLEEIVNVMRESNKNFEMYVADSSSHHIHLSEPHLISEPISNFIQKSRPSAIDNIKSKF